MNTTSTSLRFGAAFAIAIGGLVHLQLYFLGYRSIDKIGPSFLLNAIASAIIAVAVAARTEWFVRAAGILLSVATILAFIKSRVGGGLFDFREEGFEPSPQAAIALIVEIVAIVLLALTFAPKFAATDQSAPPRALAIMAGTTAVVFVALGLIWTNRYDVDTSVTVSPTSIVIRDFTFTESAVTVDAGTPVTWANTDPISHSVVAGDGSFESESLATGDTFEHTFDAAGSFPYICGIHPDMAGTITVTD